MYHFLVIKYTFLHFTSKSFQKSTPLCITSNISKIILENKNELRIRSANILTLRKVNSEFQSRLNYLIYRELVYTLSSLLKQFERLNL